MSVQKLMSTLKSNAVILGVAVAGAAAAVMLMSSTDTKTIATDSTIDGFSVKGMSEKQVGKLANRSFIIKDKKTTEKIPVSTFVSEPDLKKVAKKILSNQHSLWFLNKPVHLTITSKDFDKHIDDWVAKYNVGKSDPVNAHATFSHGTVVKTKEVLGTKIDAKRLSTVMKSALKTPKHFTTLKRVAVRPEITEKSKQFTDQVKKLEALASMSGTVKIGDKVIKISEDQLQSWLSVADGRVVTNGEAVSKFVNELNDKYRTDNKSRQFKNHDGKTIAIEPGTLGQTLDIDATTSKIVSALPNGKDFTIDASLTGSDLGKDYVEISLAKQHEWIVKNGKVVLDSPVVTGNPNNNHATPKGAYYIWSKQQNATLRGSNLDGTPYASPVDYWMPIDFTGVGLHDANWQPTFGGNWYTTHGSHGCVNNPPAFAGKLFNAVSVGTPVIVY